MKLFRYVLAGMLFCMPGVVMAQPIFTNEKQRVIEIRHNEYRNDTMIVSEIMSFAFSADRGSRFNAFDFNEEGWYGYTNGNYSYSFNDYLRAADLPEPFKDMFSVNIRYDTMYWDWRISNQGVSDTNWGVGGGYMNTMEYRDSQIVAIRSGSGARYFEYDAYGHPVHIYGTVLKNQTVDTEFIRSILYDNNGRAINDTVNGFWYGHSYNYFYNNSGKVIDITQRASGGGHDIFNYDNEGRLLTRTSTGADLRDTIFNWLIDYDVTGRITAYSGQGYSREGSYVQSRLHYNTLNEADSFIDYRYNNIGNGDYSESISKTVFYYNKYHNPDSAISFYFDNKHPSYPRSGKTYYKYETYFADTLANHDEVVLFPNPAHNEIYITWNKIFSAIPVNIVIYNSTGQEVSKTNIVKPAYTDAINIAGYAPGIYFLRIKNAENKQLYIGRFVIDR